MNIRLSSTAPEFPVAQSEPQTSVENKMNKQSPEFPVAQSEPQTSVVTYIKENSETVATQNDSFIGATLQIDPIIAFPVSKCPTTSHGIFASQIPNLHFTNIWTLVQIWTLSKYSGEYFDSFLKSKHFDSFLFYSFFQIKTVTLFQKSNVLRILLGPVEA